MTSSVLAILVGLAVCLLTAAFRRVTMKDRIARYMEPQEDREGASPPRLVLVTGWLAWGTIGCASGLLAAQGDLFVQGEGRPALALGLLGAAGGVVLRSIVETNRREARIEQMRRELPVVADSLALQILTGESIGSSLRRLVDRADGVLPMRLGAILDDSEESGIETALLSAATDADHPDERRLYDTLAHAHAFGGRVGDSLSTLAADYRATAEREITEQGGRKAVSTYAPVLALMVPTALMFLLYPTLVGLQSLGAGP